MANNKPSTKIGLSGPIRMPSFHFTNGFWSAFSDKTISYDFSTQSSSVGLAFVVDQKSLY